MDLHNEAWERVLAAVEADARRAEALLQAPADRPLPPELVDGLDPDADGAVLVDPALAVPADWVLPGPGALGGSVTGGSVVALAPPPALVASALAAPTLPPLAEMPPVPPELRERIETLRAQIAELQHQLVAALEQWQPGRTVSAVQPQAQPVYVDRRV